MVLRGSYCLCIIARDSINAEIGALGEITFGMGNYIYIGSALNSLKPRLERYYKINNRKHDVTHWHIDYLLKEQQIFIDQIFTIICSERLECELANWVSNYGKPIIGFGSSDCKCKSHLYKVDEFNFLKKRGLERYSKDSLQHLE
jgi:Uri superfamily endonuclease